MELWTCRMKSNGLLLLKIKGTDHADYKAPEGTCICLLPCYLYLLLLNHSPQCMESKVCFY